MRNLYLLVLLIFGNNTFSMIIDNLDDKRANWSAFSDDVMGGISQVNFYELEENQINFYRLEGNVSTENNGGFIQSRVNLNIKTKDYNGIRVKIRGNNNKYFIHLRGPRMLPWNYYYSSFFASNDWTIIELPLAEFIYNRKPDLGIDAKSIRSIGIVAYGKDFQAELDVAQIELY